MAQPLNETQIKRVEDAVARATASIDQTTRPLQEASQTLRELKLELERAKAGAAQGLSTQETYTRQAVETARAGEDAARRALQAKEGERARFEHRLEAARTSLEQGDEHLKDLQGQLDAIKAQNLQKGIDNTSLTNEVASLHADLKHEVTRRTNLVSSSVAREKSLTATEKQWDEQLNKLKAALKEGADAKRDLLREKRAHEATQELLSNKSEAYSSLYNQQEEERERHNGMLEKETSALKESKRKVNSVADELHELKIDRNKELRDSKQLDKQASEQLEAVVHSKCKESSTSQALPALPPVVVSSGHLPGPWSYLSFASRGVHMDSRFNSVITPAVSFDLPWVFDALDRVSKEVVASTVPVPAVVLVVLLQGIAYVQAALKMASNDVILTPRPSMLLQALSDSDNVSKSRESVVGMVHGQVSRFIHEGIQIESWIPITVFTGERLSSTNSALPEGVVLVHQDTPGTVFIVRKAADKEQLFIIEAQSVNFKWGKRPFIEMRLPSIDGLPNESREMMLMNDVEQRQIGTWAYSVFSS